jgi:hypothetical protein
MTAKLLDVTAFDRRMALLACRKGSRATDLNVVIALGTAVTACVLLAAATFAAAWFIRNVLASDPDVDTKTPSVLVISISPKRVVASAAAIANASAAPADVADVTTFAAKWAVDQIEPPAARQVPRITLTKTEASDNPQRAQSRSVLVPDPEGHTAIYDIGAHTVYLPDGNTLEAHSGLGDRFDNPLYVNIKDQGPTPPNIYNLSLREQLFHGIPALRLNPVDDSSMFGRKGILAHPYLSSASGQSNGCVSFKDYPAFLHAYLSGEINRMVVVPHLDTTASSTVSSRRDLTKKYASYNP